MAYDWQDPEQDLTYKSYLPDPRSVRVKYLTGGTRPVSGFSGRELGYRPLGAEELAVPQHTYRQIQIPGARLGAGGRSVPQTYTYNLPQAQAPASVGSSDFQLRQKAIEVEEYRKRFKWAIPGATVGDLREYDLITDPETGETSYQKREGWRTVAEEDLLGWKGKHQGTWKEKREQIGRQTALEEQAHEEAAYAKWWNETRYSQLQDLMGQHFQNQMGTLQGVGEAERSDILRGGEALQERALSQAMQRGMSGTTALSALQRGAQAETQQQLGQFYNRQQQLRLGVQQQLATQYAGVIEGRVDEYPSTFELAQIMYGSFGAGAGQEQPKQQGSGMGMAGLALGAGLGVAAAGAGAGAGAGGLLGCLCYMFLEGRHGDGTMDWVVRRYGEEKVTERGRRGYYKMSEIIVPVMRKNLLMKLLLQVFFIQPCFWWARWYYRKEIKRRGEKLGFGGRFGWIFAPIKKFWEGFCHYLGQDHPYIRWNGELV